MRLIDALEDSDDVDAVHANFDVDAEVLERVAAADRPPVEASARRRHALDLVADLAVPDRPDGDRQRRRCGSACRSGSIYLRARSSARLAEAEHGPVRC